MKNTLHFTFLRTLMILAFGLFFNGAWGQASENFSNIPASASGYANRSWTGTDNVTWTATLARTDQTLNGKAICTNGSGSVSSPVYANGMGLLQFNYVRAFTGTSNRSIEVYVNDVKIGTTISVVSNNSTVQAYSAVINQAGNVRLELRTAGGQINIDDISWTAFSATTPTLNASVTEIPSFGEIPTNSSSTSTSFSVSGSNLSSSILVNAPENFEVSSNQTSWESSVTLPNNTTLTNVPVYVRFHPLSTGLKSGNITFSGGGVTSYPTVAVSGTGFQVFPEPSNHVSNLIAIANSHTQITATWNDATGTNLPSGYLLLINQTGTFTSPVDGTDVPEDANLSDGSGVFKIAQGIQTKLITGLNPSTTYHFAIYSYSNSGTSINYKTDGLVPNATATTLVAPAVCGTEDFSNSNLTGSYGDGNFVGNNGVVWTYLASRDENADDNGSGIQGKAIMLRRASDNSKITSSTISSGIGSFSVKLYKGFTSQADRQVELFVNGVSKGQSIAFQNTEEHIFTVENINIAGNVVIEVRNITGNQVILDDITWTCYGSATSTTWNGLTWSNGVPTSSLDATIAGDYSTASTAQGAFTAKSLTINSGIFTIASGTTVTVEGIVNNTQADSNLIVKTGGNLIQTTAVANTGAITVERNSAPIVRLDHTLWSSPVVAQNLYAFSPNTLTNRFYVYNTPTDTYVTTGISATSTFVPGKGFGVRAPNNHPTTATQWLGTFKGIPNNGEVTFAASTAGTGFNLVGNPYPSAISGTAFINANPSLNGTLYFYAHSLSMDAQGVFPQGTNYATWNLTGSTMATGSTVAPNGTIQVGQGFIVKATSAGDVTFTNAMRTADTDNQFFRTASQFTANSEVEKHRLWLNLTNPEGTAFNQILIGYVAGATEGFDRGFDGLSFGNTGSFLSTKINEADYAIQARSLPFQSSDVVPVSFTATTAGSYTISLSNMDGLFSGDQTVFLKDNATNTLNDLKSGSYTFSTTQGTFNNRFEVVYQTALSTPQSDFTANSVVAFKRSNVLNVETKNFEMASLKAYDVQGRLVYSKSGINASTVQLSDLQVQNGVLLLQVTSTEGTVATIKVIY
ncbi:T9SS type A sorting domain-containing protein [Flavobacterium qiangtangense]|uniref:T9SS type A sorting domain-containing protein n=1 Tax=Flavobacterium qiangtangense TaxID=1442595 RepID=A0ABW1PMG7_9FLAO